jgi:putative hydrolase of the HAD superfamily
MIKIVIFDFGGVVHSLEGGSLNNIANVYGISPQELGPILKSYALDLSIGKISERRFWEGLSKELKRPVPDSWSAVWNIALANNVFYPEIIDLVKKLNVREIRAVVLSNTIPPHAEFIRQKGWYEGFDKVYLSCEIGYRKPDIKAYELVLKDQETLGKECVYIDDLEENLVPARELGMVTILAKSPKQVVDAVEEIMKLGN